MSYHYIAFFMGLLGSLHCAAMCGPLLMAIHGQSSFSWRQTLNKFLYQLGRILTYGWIGLVLGSLGKLAAIKGWQQGFSLTTGILLVVIGLFYFVGHQQGGLAKLQTRLLQPFVRTMGRWLYRPGGSFVAGVLNGVLPCGMVYMALASAVNADGALNSFLFMVLFGLGTLPLMLSFSVFAYVPKNVFKLRFAKLLPFFYLVMGAWFILRGANLDIPYLSPLLYVDGAMECG